MYEASVSVVIPTTGRPELRAAVASALCQSHRVHDVLVVADTEHDLDLPDDDRVQVLRVGPGAGGNAARQAGVRAARGGLVALLDDDDTWTPDHLERVVDRVAAVATTDSRWIAASRLFAVRESERRRDPWPTRFKTPAETLEQYMFRKHRVRQGTGFLQASTLVFPRQLAIDVPFDETLRFHQDISWLVAVERAHPGVRLVQSTAPTVRYTVRSGSVSRRISGQQSVVWALDHLDPADQRTVGDFILTHSLNAARNEGKLGALLWTARAALVHGRPGAPALLYAAAFLIREVVGLLRKAAHP